MRRLIMCAIACCLASGAWAQQLATTNAPKGNKEVVNRSGKCDTATVLSLFGPDTVTYLKMCADIGGKINGPIFEAHTPQFIVWDWGDNKIDVAVTLEQAEAIKGDNESADIVPKDDAAFSPLLDAWKYRAWVYRQMHPFGAVSLNH